jgi:hypothetical protein
VHPDYSLTARIPQDTGHAFILRRFDTGAISLTTMFRAAFPNASDADERTEIQWVRDTYDLSGNNGSTKDAHITRLAGTWVSPQVALELGQAYALGEIIEAVVQATPDPNGNYRRSGKAAAATSATPTQPVVAAAGVSVTKGISPTESTFSGVSTTAVIAGPTSVVVSKPPSAVRSLPTPSPTSNKPPSKRRKESSPAPTSQSSKPPSSRGSPAPTKIPTPRRSARTKSPAPRSAATTVLRTPKATRSSARKEAVAGTSITPGASDLTAVEEENQLVEDGVAGSELHDEDVREQQKLIQDLKSKRDAAKAKVERVEMDVVEEYSFKKREREEEEEELRFEFKEPETQERAIATNRRVGRFHLEPRAKSFVWGIAAFAVGMGAA